MITFYPRRLGLWSEADFDFGGDITLTPKSKYRYKVFRDRAELIDFLKSRGVRLDDPERPLRIETASENVYKVGNAAQGQLFIVVQWTVIGWIRDNFIA